MSDQISGQMSEQMPAPMPDRMSGHLPDHMPDHMPEPILEVRNVSAWYGEARALTEVSLSVGAGEVVTDVTGHETGRVVDT